MNSSAEKAEQMVNSLGEGEFFYSVRMTGVYGRSAGPAKPVLNKNVRFSVYHVRDGEIAEELGHEEALTALLRLGLVPSP